jgi:hypothetical protein
MGRMTMANEQIKTQWVKPKKPRKITPNVKLDISTLQITDDKPVLTRIPIGNKYAPLFQQLKPGQCVKCKSEDTGKVSTALRNWIMDHLDVTKFSVKCVRSYPEDGMGRVWLIQKGGAS